MEFFFILLYGKAAVIICYFSTNLLNSLNSSKHFFDVEFSGFSLYKIISLANKDHFISIVENVSCTLEKMYSAAVG